MWSVTTMYTTDITFQLGPSLSETHGNYSQMTPFPLWLINYLPGVSSTMRPSIPIPAVSIPTDLWEKETRASSTFLLWIHCLLHLDTVGEPARVATWANLRSGYRLRPFWASLISSLLSTRWVAPFMLRLSSRRREWFGEGEPAIYLVEVWLMIFLAIRFLSNILWSQGMRQGFSSNKRSWISSFIDTGLTDRFFSDL